jgi:hypothetical protein
MLEFHDNNGALDRRGCPHRCSLHAPAHDGCLCRIVSRLVGRALARNLYEPLLCVPTNEPSLGEARQAVAIFLHNVVPMVNELFNDKANARHLTRHHLSSGRRAIDKSPKRYKSIETLAWGRDYGDVSPLRGLILGGGAHTLKVGVEPHDS